MTATETVLLFIAGLLTGTGTGGLLALWATNALDRKQSQKAAHRAVQHQTRDIHIHHGPTGPIDPEDVAALVRAYGKHL